MSQRIRNIALLSALALTVAGSAWLLYIFLSPGSTRPSLSVQTPPPGDPSGRFWALVEVKPPGNIPPGAAATYWKAFALQPACESDIEEAIDHVFQGDALSADLVALARQSDEPVRLMRQAGTEPCDWGIDLSQGPHALLPHLQHLRNTASLAILHGCWKLDEGDAEAAIEDWMGALRAGRHASSGDSGLMICRLVDAGISQKALTVIARRLPSMKEADVRLLAERLKALPAAPSPAQVMRTEKACFTPWLRRELIDNTSPQDRPKKLAELFAMGGDSDKSGIMQMAWLATSKGLEDAIADLESHYDSAAATIQSPTSRPAQVREAIRQEEQKTRSAGPFTRAFMPACGAVYERCVADDVLFQMLMAAIAVQSGGPQRLADFPDPSTGEPFTRVNRGNGGFELHSTWQAGRRPVTLTVGR